ncbi:MAG: hypothetical protein ACFFDF_12075 [Candidatus Odinarchaeota archaeon]
MTQKESQNESEKELRISMDREFFSRLEIIKLHYGIKNNTEIIRFMINDKYREIQTHFNKRIFSHGQFELSKPVLRSLIIDFIEYSGFKEIRPSDIAFAFNLDFRKVYDVCRELKKKGYNALILE